MKKVRYIETQPGDIGLRKILFWNLGPSHPTSAKLLDRRNAAISITIDLEGCQDECPHSGRSARVVADNCRLKGTKSEVMEVERASMLFCSSVLGQWRMHFIENHGCSLD